jgi:hypothetical protein
MDITSCAGHLGLDSVKLLVSLWLATFCWIKSLLCNDAFKQGFSYFQSLLIQSYTSRRFCTDSKLEKSDPLHPSGCSTVQASFVRTTRTFCPDLPLCREPSNFSWLHPSRRLSNTVGRLSVFDKEKDFVPKHRYGKTATTVRTMCVPI